VAIQLNASRTQRMSWLSRAANKVATVASSVSAKTASVLDFHSGAADVIVIKHVLANGDVELCSTNWAVHAGRDNKTTLSEETVDIFVNGRPTHFKMFVGEGHNCTFGGGALRPAPEDLEDLELRDGLNELGFSVSSAPNTRFTAELWVWPADVAIVLCDIDGTITRSDILGYGAHKLGFDAAHSGVSEAFQAIERQGYRTVYVSARPITKAAKTREMLAMVGRQEGGFEMPRGPLITTSERSLAALVRSFRRRGGGADDFKVGALNDIASAFEVGGRRLRPRVFYGGFGNRATDAQAYSSAGVPKNRIFIIDERSRLSLRETRELFDSYAELLSEIPRFFPPVKDVQAKEAAEEVVYEDEDDDQSSAPSGSYVPPTLPDLNSSIISGLSLFLSPPNPLKPSPLPRSIWGVLLRVEAWNLGLGFSD
jgi:phosphatidate phosphatase PAH1